jgi:Cd2+/Zn2+-exporting ATPase
MNPPDEIVSPEINDGVSKSADCPRENEPSQNCAALSASRLTVTNARCRDCPLSLENRLRKIPGATQVKANPGAKSAHVHFDSQATTSATFEQNIKSAGFKIRAAPANPKQLRESWQEQDAERNRLAFLSGLCLLATILAWVGDATSMLPRSGVLLLYGAAYLAGGFEATRRAMQELRGGSLNVDLLMVLAALGAASVGDWREGAVLLFLFSLSNALEGFVLGRTRRAISALMDLSPDEAGVLRDGIEVRVPIEDLRRDETIIIRPGERIAADGQVLQGHSEIDQSAMTGESVPIFKAEGDEVFAGTLNGRGALEVRVTKLASESTLSRIVALVEEAQSEKAPAQRFTDWFGARYTFAVLAASAMAIAIPILFFAVPFQSAFYRAMTLLVVASPCAIVISIPAAIMAAIAGGARSGVLFKGGAHLETLAKVRAVAFDKTGTLTVGRPQLVGLAVADGETEAEVLRLAASAESQSEHPLAKAVVEAATQRGLSFETATQTQALVGRGLQARVDGKVVFIGREKLWRELGVLPEPTLQRAAENFTGAGHTTFFIGDQTRVLGVLSVADALRESARPALRELQKLNVEHITMLTGDSESVAQKIAGELNMSYRAELLPGDKLEAIKEIQSRYGVTVMLGDGINDAPSLAAADLGISLGATGTDVALETADVVLMADDLRHLPHAIALARQTQRIILQNLVFAFGMMALLIIGTFFASLRLPVAVLGHEGSTVLVILNGLRLLAYRPRAA